MSERIALDYTNGGGEPIPPETWTNIDPERVVALAMRHIDNPGAVRPNMSLISFIQLVEPTISDELRARLLAATGKETLAIDDYT